MQRIHLQAKLSASFFAGGTASRSRPSARMARSASGCESALISVRTKRPSVRSAFRNPLPCPLRSRGSAGGNRPATAFCLPLGFLLPSAADSSAPPSIPPSQLSEPRLSVHSPSELDSSTAGTPPSEAFRWSQAAACDRTT